ncbi:interferon lambda-3-like [Dermochelys coriacea]|uniref:interferon lambda-3-like n=1 Tax=Dermochelys coriacea TaxID=27794 RepID=UPI0018E721B6|nr:interferon lambda-3-like [Dermochelys coriacea]
MVNVGYKVLFALAIWTMTTEAFPKGTERTTCHLTKYKSLPPQELEAFKKAKDKFEDIMLLSDRKCSTRIFHRNWEVQQLSEHDRVILVEKELDFTINVLENVEDPSLSKLLSRPLEILTQIRGDLRSCIRETHSHRHSRKLNNWLQNFHERKETEIPGCLEASVILNLFQLLNKDLRCAAYRELCG